MPATETANSVKATRQRRKLLFFVLAAEMRCERSFREQHSRGRLTPPVANLSHSTRSFSMAKPHHKLKKANHGRRPANAKARKAKRRKVKT
jgi:hypothetical protein